MNWVGSVGVRVTLPPYTEPLDAAATSREEYSSLEVARSERLWDHLPARDVRDFAPPIPLRGANGRDPGAFPSPPLVSRPNTSETGDA